jgi:hypothetical protein
MSAYVAGGISAFCLDLAPFSVAWPRPGGAVDLSRTLEQTALARISSIGKNVN